MVTSKKGRKVHVAPNSIVVGGKKYYNVNSARTKINANKKAKEIRDSGHLAVIKKTHGLYGRWSIYTRR